MTAVLWHAPKPQAGVIETEASPSAAAGAPAQAQVHVRLRVFRGEMDQETFYTSAVSAGIDDRLIPEIAAAFAFDFDFVREVHPGDVFEAAVEEEINPQGDAIGPPRLRYVSLVTAVKSKALYRFQVSPDSPAGWYDADGRTTRRSLMRTPVEGARITSTFGMRDHPVLGFTRMHKGIDFGTPIGTPVYASGDGTIAILGPRGDYGFYLRIAHSSSLATAYGHLSGFAPGLSVGSRVRQGEVVAYSGNTGISTGPHLHYEVLVNGEQVNPLEYKVDEGPPLEGAALARFLKERDRIDELRSRLM